MFKKKVKINSSTQKSTTGFTLVEMLVAIAVFMTVMTVAVGSLISIIEANRKAQAIKSVIDNINFAVETISRDMRVAQNYSCDSNDIIIPNNPDFSTRDCQSGGLAVQYQKTSSEYIQYRFVANPNSGDGNLQRRICPFDGVNINCSPDASAWHSITAPTSILQITSMKFYVLGTSALNQPRVLITVDGIAGEKDSDKTNFTLQTSISQRILNKD